MTASPLDKPYDYAVSRLAAAGGDVEALPLPLQTLLLVEMAQTMIDSGGLEYFFEADFPNNPAYEVFVQAYRRIGAGSAADCIEASAQMFPFAEPQFFEELRQVWLEKMRVDPQFASLGERVTGDASVWQKLSEYVLRNSEAFGDG
ncbi:MAG TPA: DUF4375 domain-containing protein [Ramlibacter sp.]